MEEVEKKPKSGWVKFFCIIGGILMSILGIIMFIRPIATANVIIWLAFAGLLINGIIEIVKFCKQPKGQKDGWGLALGILWIIISILMFALACGAPFVYLANMKMFLAIMIGFTCIFAGICNICTCKQHNSTALAIIGGILQIIVGIFVLCNPVFGFLTVELMFAIYLVVMGIVYIVNTCTDK